MGLFTKIEEISEKIIEGFFKTKFAGDIQPVEIAKRLAREMSDKKAISVSKVYVPNEYKVFLNLDDMEKIKAVEKDLSGELRSYLQDRARSKNFTLTHEPTIVFIEDSKINKGSFKVSSKFTGVLENIDIKTSLEITDKETEKEKDNEKEFTQIFKNMPINTKKLSTLNRKRSELVVISGDDEGMAFLLNTKKKVIGRRPTNEIFVNDLNVSRQHAQIEARDAAYIITDLGSTNGTFVNGNRITTHKLEENDRVKIGTTLFEYRVVQ